MLGDRRVLGASSSSWRSAPRRVAGDAGRRSGPVIAPSLIWCFLLLPHPAVFEINQSHSGTQVCCCLSCTLSVFCSRSWCSPTVATCIMRTTEISKNRNPVDCHYWNMSKNRSRDVASFKIRHLSRCAFQEVQTKKKKSDTLTSKFYISLHC